MTNETSTDRPTAPQPEPEALPPADPTIARLEEQQAEIARLTEETAKLKDQLLRAMAETENTRRRLEAQAEDRGRFAVSAFAKDMLQVADNLRRALDAIPADALNEDALARTLAEGVDLTERGLLGALERHGIVRVAALGERFDPNRHQAMMEVEDASQPPGTVVMEMQAGYLIHDRLLRPAMVGVAKGGPAAAPGAAGVDTRA